MPLTLDKNVPVGKLPWQVHNGASALTVQGYVERNVKGGKQFELSLSVAMVASSTQDYIVITGAKPIAIKGRRFVFDNIGIDLKVYKAPTVSGGTTVPYFNCNSWNPTAGLAVIKLSPTVTAVGTECFAPETLLGSSGSGPTRVSSYATESGDVEHILAPNTTYLFRRINRAAAVQNVSMYSTWYEGDLDYNA